MIHSWRRMAGLSCLVLFTALLSGIGAPAYAAGGKLDRVTKVPIVGMPFAVTGRLSSRMRRPVVLKVQRGQRWVTVARTVTGKSGRFRFAKLRINRPSTKNFLAVARKFKSPELVYARPRIVTRPIQVTAVAQSGQLDSLPPIAQQGPVPADPAQGEILAAGFTPARPGRPVVLQRQSGNDWATVATSSQDLSGWVLFDTPGPGSYRARTLAQRGAPEVVTPVITARTFRLDFDETFSNAATSKFKDKLVGVNAEGGRSCAENSPDTHHTTGGVLRLGIALDPSRPECAWQSGANSGVGPFLLNSQLATEQTYQFTYGIAAARIRFQGSKGLHGCFWLMHKFPKVPGQPSQGAEVDIAEYFGPLETVNKISGLGAFTWELDASSRLVRTGSNHPEAELMKPAGDRFYSSYHVFSVEWTTAGYIFRIDGREFWRTKTAVSRTPLFLSLSLLTSDWERRNFDLDDLNETMEVDWVRVWQ